MVPTFGGLANIANIDPLLRIIQIFFDEIYNNGSSFYFPHRKNMENIGKFPMIFFLLIFTFHDFYLPHMEYEGSIGLVSRKMINLYC
jgi:hypothetical protein